MNNLNKLYNILDGIADILSDKATIIKRDGLRLENIPICAEIVGAETLTGRYPMGVNDQLFSISRESLIIDGEYIELDAGDMIETENGRYKIVKDPQTGKTCAWKWERPGGRIIIRTQELKS